MSGSKDFRTYQRAECAIFRKTAEAYGGLSNMAPGFPVRVNGVRILTVEALYQACRFPHRPEVQRKIIEQSSPMTAKMVGKPFRNDSRPDWDRVRVKIMRWVLRLKLAMHWTQFSELLLSTGDWPIVEDSRKDDFWGAVPIDNTTLVGMNVLGRLLMELREEVKQGVELRLVEPPAISDFLLFDEQLGVIDFRNGKSDPYVAGVEEEIHAVNNFSLPLFGDELVEPPSERLVERLPLPAVKQRPGMIADLKPYAAYKDSGLAWLGKVPEHWDVRPTFGAFIPNRDRNFGMKEKTVLSLSYGRIVIKPPEKLHGLVPDSFETYQIVNPGDIVVRTTDLQNDHTSLRIGMVRNRGIITSAYLALRVQGGVSSDFGFQFLSVWDASKAIYGYGSGLRQSLSFSDFKRMPVAVPPPEEQAAIVRFLDWANIRLDRTIRAKRRVIALLTEQKQAIIHRAVTRGLDSTIPLKPSGIPWLGDIPAHWEVRRVKQATRILRGKFTHRPRNDPSLYDGAYPFIQTGIVARAKKFITSYNQTLNDKGLAVSKTFPGGTLVMTIAANIGEVAVLTFDACFPDSIVGFVPSKNADRDYLYLVFRCMKAEFMAEAPVNTQGNLNVERIGAMGIPFPSLAEQEIIAKTIEEETASFDIATSRLNREIDFLREYRTRLVADVVTGKLDVREVAAQLPFEPAECEAVEESEAEMPDEIEDDEASVN